MDHREESNGHSASALPGVESAELELRPELTVDLTDQLYVVNDFQVDDRVERLSGDTERSHWGTILSHIDFQGGDEWLVLDNDGVTHLDAGGDLAPARRGRYHRPPHEPKS